MFEFNLQNLHHAYLIEGDRQENLPLLLGALKNINIKIENNPDFHFLTFDSFKIDDARAIKQRESEKSFVEGKKIFIISAGGFLSEAQNALLKSLEEPKEDTHFFILVDRVNVMIPTLVSRCLVVKNNNQENKYSKKAEVFIKMNLKDRIDFIKSFLAEKKEQEEGDNVKNEVLNFLNALEQTLYKNKSKLNPRIFEHLMNIRGALYQPGSSAKMLFESVAIELS